MGLPRTEADVRTVLNPFTRKDSRMRRNTRGSRWVSDKTKHSGDQNEGTGKNASFQERRNSFDYNDRTVSDDGITSDASSEPLPILEAAIYNAKDLNDLPDAYVRLPSVRSWSSLRGSIDDDHVSPRTTTYSGKNDIRSPVSPVNNDPITGRNISIEPNDFAATAEERKASDSTIFHSFSASVKKPAIKTKNVHGDSDLAVFYRTARSIYNVGPKGEGQKLWSGYKRIQKGQKQHAEVDQQVPDHVAAPRRPSAPGLSAHPPTRPAPPNTDIPIRQAVLLTETLYPRKKSQVSMTSCEVPIRIGPDVKLVDRSRPLPPVPQLQATPKTRQHGYGLAGTSKPLPSSPSSRAVREVEPAQINANRPLPPIPRAPSMRQHSSPRPKESLASLPQTQYSSSSAPRTQHPTQRGVDPMKANSKPPESKSRNKATHWWKTLAELTSEDHIPTTHNNKPTISRPRPITALESGCTANLAPECGGLGGHSAARAPLSERAKGKQRLTTHDKHVPTPHVGMHFPKHWREKLGTPVLDVKAGGGGKKRVDSDASFGCVGVEEGHGAYGCGSSGQMEDRGMRPEPLFLGKRGDEGEQQRDTRFYGLYCEVLDEY